MSLICEQNQLPESSENSKTTLEKGGKSPPDVKLDFILEDLFKYFNELEILCKTKKEIEKKYDIVKEHDDCWPEDDIKRAWGKTQRIDYYLRRNRWALVIVLQVLKRQRTKEEKSDLNEGRNLVQRCAELSLIDTPDQMKAERENGGGEDVLWSTVDINQTCGKAENMKVISKERSTQSSDELKTVGAAGGVEQMFGEGKKVFKVSSLSEDSGVASGSQPSASSTDVAPLPTEVNPIGNSSNSKTKNAALVNEEEDTLVNNCEQQKYVDNYELCLADKENVKLKNGLWSTVKQACSKAQRMKKNSEDRSAQSSAEPKIAEAVGGVNQQTTNTNQGQTGSASQGQSGTSFQPKRKLSWSDPGDLDEQSGTDDSEASETETGVKRFREEKPIYIRIPLSKVFDNESTSTTLKPTTNVIPKYKLIDLPPEDGTKSNEIKKKGFYVMSYNNETNNAKWVYEILNLNTLPSYYKTPEFKDSDSDSDSKDPSYKPSKRSDPFKNTDYDRGHLAAVANHKWCQEAYEETYWESNMTPQNKHLNRGKWKKLEEYCRKKILNDNVHNVHVYTGPLYQNDNLEDLGEVGQKAVPSDFFKVIIVEKEGGEVELECYKMSNGQTEVNENSEEDAKDNWLKSYKVDINEIERLSGLMFTEKYSRLTEVDHTRTATWKGNKGKKSVTIDVTISSYKKNDENPQVLNEE